MTTARKLEPSPRDRSSDIPASQDWSSETLADTWLAEVAEANRIRTDRLHRALVYSDPTADAAIYEVERQRRQRNGGKHRTADRRRRR